MIGQFNSDYKKRSYYCANALNIRCHYLKAHYILDMYACSCLNLLITLHTLTHRNASLFNYTLKSIYNKTI